jgi:hypothetical protein
VSEATALTSVALPSSAARRSGAGELSALLAAIFFATIDEPCFVLRPAVNAAAFGAYGRGSYDRKLIRGAYLDTSGHAVAGRRAVDHDDSHDPLLYPITSNRAQNLGDGVTKRGMGDLPKPGRSPHARNGLI